MSPHLEAAAPAHYCLGPLPFLCPTQESHSLQAESALVSVDSGESQAPLSSVILYPLFSATGLNAM